LNEKIQENESHKKYFEEKCVGRVYSMYNCLFTINKPFELIPNENGYKGY